MKLPILQGIETRYLGPTNTKGGRIRARAWAGSVTIPYDHALTIEGNHRAAAMTLAAELGWHHDAPAEHWATGGNAKGDGYVHVNAGRNLWTREAAKWQPQDALGPSSTRTYPTLASRPCAAPTALRRLTATTAGQ